MARKSKKLEQRKQDLLSNVPIEQRKMITQPTTFAYLNGEMSVMHARIQMVIMDKLQEKIKRSLEKEKAARFIGDLFDDADFKPIDKNDKTPYLTFTVKYSELGVEPPNYKFVSEAARAMIGSLVYEKEENGYKRYIDVFPIIDVPDETKGERRVDIKLHMTKAMAKDLFDLTRFQKYLKDAISLFSSGYSVRIYLLINANKDFGTWTVKYDELRRILLTTRDEKTKKWVVDKYKDISDFKKRVLEPARKEILAAKDRVDCTFEYELLYPEGKKRGTPDSILFKIHKTDVGRKIKQIEVKPDTEGSPMLTVLLSVGVSETLARKIITQTEGCHDALLAKIQELKQYIVDAQAGKHPKVDDVGGFLAKSLKNFVKAQNATSTAEPFLDFAPAALPSHQGMGQGAESTSFTNPYNDMEQW